MRSCRTGRGFAVVEHEKYGEDVLTRLIQESSAIDFDLDISAVEPGTSFLWVGQDHHLNFKEVEELVSRMQHCLDTGHLAVDCEGD